MFSYGCEDVCVGALVPFSHSHSSPFFQLHHFNFNSVSIKVHLFQSPNNDCILLLCIIAQDRSSFEKTSKTRCVFPKVKIRNIFVKLPDFTHPSFSSNRTLHLRTHTHTLTHTRNHSRTHTNTHMHHHAPIHARTQTHNQTKLLLNVPTRV